MELRLRVPFYLDRYYSRRRLNRHYEEEGYRCSSTYAKNPVLTFIGCIAAYLEPLRGGKVPLELHVRGKDAEANAKQFEQCLSQIKNAGVRQILCLHNWVFTNDFYRRKSVYCLRKHPLVLLRKNGRKPLMRRLKIWSQSMLPWPCPVLLCLSRTRRSW